MNVIAFPIFLLRKFRLKFVLSYCIYNRQRHLRKDKSCMWESRIHSATSPIPSLELLPWAQAMEERGPEPVPFCHNLSSWHEESLFQNRRQMASSEMFLSPEIPTEQNKLGLSHSSGIELSQSFIFFPENPQKKSQSFLISLMYCIELLSLSAFSVLQGFFWKKYAEGICFTVVFSPRFQRWNFQIPSNSTIKS